MKKTAYVKIIGEESDSKSDTLQKTVKKISEAFELISDPKNIKYDTSIYLVAHGNDTSITSEVKFGDKTPKEVCEIVRDIFKEAKSLDEFKGKIILEGCHTAEPVPTPKPQLKECGRFTKKILSETCKIEKSSFLANFLEEFKEFAKSNTTSANILSEVTVGGYLGAAYDGDYSKTGYGIASTTNPLTIRYQQDRKADFTESDWGISYHEYNSFLEIRVGKEIPFGKASKGKGR